MHTHTLEMSHVPASITSCAFHLQSVTPLQLSNCLDHDLALSNPHLFGKPVVLTVVAAGAVRGTCGGFLLTQKCTVCQLLNRCAVNGYHD